MALTDTAARQAKAKDKDYKISDGRGLFLLIKVTGAKYWRFAYRYAGKQKLLALGVYPETGLKAARDLLNDARKKLRDGIDPGTARKAEKLSRITAHENTFERVLWEWFAKEEANWSSDYIDKQQSIIKNHLLPHLGQMPITEITPPTLLAALRKIEGRGILETASRARGIAGHVFRYAIVTGRAERDSSADLKGALKSPQVKHYAAITEPKEFGALLRAIDCLNGNLIVTTAIKLAPLVFQRPGELRKMEWAEIDLDKGQWDIPVAKMKMKIPHTVPLSRQAVALLRGLQPLTGRCKYVFPSERSRDGKVPISENTLNACLQRMGYSNEQHVPHGFRASARTMLAEVEGLEFSPELIEQQLAHKVKDANGRAYNRTMFLPQRRQMMQRWADYCDELKTMDKVPLRSGHAT